MCLKSKAELEICSSKIEKWIDCVGPWYHICWYMFAKYPPLWWWKNKNKHFFFDSIPCLCSGAKSRFFMAKSVFFGWSNPSNPSFSGGTSRPFTGKPFAGRATSPRFKLSKISASPWIQILPLPWCQSMVNSLPWLPFWVSGLGETKIISWII